MRTHKRHPVFRRLLIIAIFSMILMTGTGLADEAMSEDSAQRKATEYKVKAVYIYNFLLFVNWPQTDQQAESDQNKEVVIGILGKDPFGDSFKDVENKPLKGKKKTLRIKRLDQFTPQTSFDDCHLLFICQSEMEKLADILKKIDNKPILTVADSEGFAENGGMINLLMVGPKVRWEINQAAAEKTGLTISSQILRNATRVIRNNSNQSDRSPATRQKQGIVQ
ncbi:MAG: YfiR family protein [Planctomycetota bacterium]